MDHKVFHLFRTLPKVEFYFLFHKRRQKVWEIFILEKKNDWLCWNRIFGVTQTYIFNYNFRTKLPLPVFMRALSPENEVSIWFVWNDVKPGALSRSFPSFKGSKGLKKYDETWSEHKMFKRALEKQRRESERINSIYLNEKAQRKLFSTRKYAKNLEHL